MVRSLLWDHPREYGENIAVHDMGAVIEGSSPRIRGELSMLMALSILPGIIPANTGRIWCRGGELHPAWDHPREYGENQVEFKLPPGEAGSSPRIRGESTLYLPDQTILRIIPANTGRIPRSLFASSEDTDHPREYGENCVHHCACSTRLGSSPRIRGELSE